jgi:double-strand break repair protein MRE11
LVKGNSKIALYGIGNLKDERLFLALQNKKVNFHRPDDFKNWFNILIVHQNRFKGHHQGKNKKNFLPEKFIPSFFDLVIWGHEHECFTEPIYNSEMGFHVYQPGSSVVTSLIQAESKSKSIGLLEVHLDKFRIIPLKLETVRPFIYQQFELRNYAYRLHVSEDVEKLIEEKIEEMLIEASNSRKNQNPSQMIEDNEQINQIQTLPILRMKIEFSGYQMTRTNFIVSKFSGRIANPNDVIQFYKKGEPFQVRHGCGGGDDHDEKTGEWAFNLEEEMQNKEDGLRLFVNQNVCF